MEFKRKHESDHTQKRTELANETILEIYLSGLVCESDSQLTVIDNELELLGNSEEGLKKGQMVRS